MKPERCGRQEREAGPSAIGQGYCIMGGAYSFARTSVAKRSSMTRAVSGVSGL
jgi:hypothetical protein